jgi:DNA-binding transcriptional ArsR family regulator
MSLKFDLGNIDDDEVEKLLKLCDALSSITRLDILLKMKGHREASHDDIAKLTDKSPATISSHMKLLVDAGIVEEAKVKGLQGRFRKIPRFLLKEIVIKL